MLYATDMRNSDAVLGPLTGATMLAALYLIFVVAPTEAEMGIVQRIFYFHVASAWVAFLCFFTVAGASAAYLWRGSQAADRLALASGEVGVLFCTLVLVTGPIWARPIWGVWWTWDPRLTMTVILWAIYAGYLMLRAFGGEDEAVARYAAVLGIVGVLDIPIIRVSVRLLHGMHPAVISREGGSGLVDPWMRVTLYVSSLAMVLLAAWLVALRTRSERLAAEVAALRREADERRGAVA
jgi:heme exporter protein C